MRRGDVITVALQGDLGKPRPAVVVQSDDYATGPTVLICPFTTGRIEADAYRLTVYPAPENGLQRTSQIMLDKISPPLREKCGPVIGRLDDDQLTELTRRLVALVGAA